MQVKCYLIRCSCYCTIFVDLICLQTLSVHMCIPTLLLRVSHFLLTLTLTVRPVRVLPGLLFQCFSNNIVG